MKITILILAGLFFSQTFPAPAWAEKERKLSAKEDTYQWAFEDFDDERSPLTDSKSKPAYDDTNG